MNAADFPAFYRELHGFDPFPWQIRLAAALCENRWPAGVHVPTGCGKTSTLDAFVFALAVVEAGHFPRRFFYVIDRRVVVDDILAHAAGIAAKLRQAQAAPASAPVLAAVAGRLSAFSGGGVPLVACGMRGGTRLELDWALAPDQPALIVSTIDQTGSRLLFRGYGASAAAWPIHAGLTGCDALLALDEAHLSQTFADTIEWVQRAASAEQPLAAPPRILQLTATPRALDGEIVQLQDDDYAQETIQRRISRPKLARLAEVSPDQFSATAVAEAQGLLQSPGVRVVAVIVNRVALARQIFERARKTGGVEAFLLTGRIRPLDRDRLMRRVLPRCHARRDRTVEFPPTFIVATQTIEVGADLDFDALVTQSAPLPALRQRFGRLNRLGLRDSAEAVVLHAPADEAASKSRDKSDPVYGDDLKNHWEWLRQAEKRLPRPARAKRGQPAPPVPRLDFAAAAWSRFTRASGEPPVTVRRGPEEVCHSTGIVEDPGEPPVTVRRGPVLLPAHARLLAHTSPTPEPDLDVQPWLHGVESGPADIFVCWRADLDEGNREHWPEIVSLLPPRRGELLALPFSAFLRWMVRHDCDAALADAEGVRGRSFDRDELCQPVLRWDADEPVVVRAKRIRPGDTIVLSAAVGGTDEYGFNPQFKPAADLAEAALADALRGRKRTEFVCRLHPKTAPPGTFPPGWLAEALARLEEGETLTAQETAPFLSPVLKAQSHAGLDDIVAGFVERHPDLEVAPYPSEEPEGLVTTFETPVSVASREEADVAELDFAETVRHVVTIPDHSARVGSRARAYAQRCGLPEPIQRALELAGLSHDLGKHAPHFQLQLRGGAPDCEPGVALAKLAPQVRPAPPYHPGWRHEALSAALVAQLSASDFLGVDLELVRYLAGASHGRGRPFFLGASAPPSEAVEVRWDGRLLRADVRHGLDSLDSGWCESWHRLGDRYGLWGVAWLESILRLADQRVSSEEAA